MKIIELKTWNDEVNKEIKALASVMWWIILILAFNSWKAVVILVLISIPSVIKIKEVNE